jgi:hypothetical protein
VATNVALTSLTAADANSGLDSTPYYIELATDTGFTTGLQNSGWDADGSWAPTLSTDTTYYWRVKARDAVGNESVQAGHTADTSGYGTFSTNYTPTAPTTLYASDDTAQSGSSNPTDLTDTTPAFSAICNDPDSGDILNKARIQVSTDSTFSSVTHWDSGSSGTTISSCTAGDRSQDIVYGSFGAAPISSLALDDGSITYYWRIKFWDDGGLEGSWSEITSTQTFTLLDTPTAPSDVSASRNSDTQFTVTWTDASSNEDGFKIERNTDTGSGFGGWTQIATASAGATSFIDNSTNNSTDPPQADERYQYRVRAYNTVGNSPYGTDSAIHYTTPDTPSNVSGAYVSDSEFTVSYTDNASVEDTHAIERCDNAGCDTPAYSAISGSPFEFSPQTDTTAGLAADGRYRWRVQAQTPEPLTSSWAYSNYQYTTPTAPSGLSATYVSDTEFTLNWTDNSSYEDGFKIERKDNGGAWTQIDTDASSPYTDSTTSSDNYYEYRIRAYKGSLNSTYDTDATLYYTTPSAPTIGTPTVNSATAITWKWADNSSYEDSFRVDYVAGTASATDKDGIAANSTSWQDTDLSVNTAYSVHVHSYRIDRGESVASVESSTVYTLANVPGVPTVSHATDSTLKVTIDVNSNPSATEFAIHETGQDKYVQADGTLGDSAAWQTYANWGGSSGTTVTGLSANTAYAFEIKARNGDNIETGFGSSASGTTGTGVTVPTAPTIGAPTVLSSSSIRWNFTDNADNETGFKLYSTGHILLADDANADLSYIDETGLSENTPYSGRHVIAYNGAGESDDSADAATVYTLADTPTNLSASDIGRESITLSVNSLFNASSGSSGYYFTNTTNSTNSGWLKTNSWTDTNLSCGNSYSYTVKYRNGDGVETSTISLNQTTLDCPADNAAPPQTFTPPNPPEPTLNNPAGNFSVLINQGAKTTTSKNITLTLIAGSNTTQMSISENVDFINANIEPFQNVKQWQLSSGYGLKTIYVKFYTQYGQASAVFSDDIELIEVVEEIKIPEVEESIEDIQPFEPEVEIPEEEAWSPGLKVEPKLEPEEENPKIKIPTEEDKPEVRTPIVEEQPESPLEISDEKEPAIEIEPEVEVPFEEETKLSEEAPKMFADKEIEPSLNQIFKEEAKKILANSADGLIGSLDSEYTADANQTLGQKFNSLINSLANNFNLVKEKLQMIGETVGNGLSTSVNFLADSFNFTKNNTKQVSTITGNSFSSLVDSLSNSLYSIKKSIKYVGQTTINNLAFLRDELIKKEITQPKLSQSPQLSVVPPKIKPKEKEPTIKAIDSLAGFNLL